MTHALRGVAAPLAYCEIEEGAVAVLRARIGSGALPSAPIHPDVRNLAGSSAVPAGSVDIVLAGFPCTGFSTMGLQCGFDNAGSGLYNHIVRLVRELLPPLVFLENVPNVVNMALHRIVSDFSELGYVLRWCLLSASQMGAPHERRRWFCLAIKKTAEARDLALRAGEAARDWKWWQPFKWEPPGEDRAERRMSYDPRRESKKRCALLGNAVVPDCVRRAFVALATLDPEMTRAVPAPVVLGMNPTAYGMSDGTGPGGVSHVPPRYFDLPPERPTGSVQPNLVFDPEAYHSSRPPSTMIATGMVTKPIRKTFWSTPRHTIAIANYLTTRTSKDLATQIRFERNTPDVLRDGIINPEFVEYMMGYPRGWTED
jgi:hypothetical protein